MDGKTPLPLFGQLFPAVTQENLPVVEEQVHTRLKSYPAIIFTHSLLGPLLLWMLWDHVDHRGALLWLALVWGQSLLDAFSVLRYRQETQTVVHLSAWFRRFAWLSMSGGLIWGSAAWFLFAPDSLEQQALLIVVMTGLAAGSVTINPSFAPSLYMYAGGVLGLLIVRMATVGDVVHSVLAVMLVLYAAFILGAGRNLSATFLLALQRGWERHVLLEALVKQNELAETARRQAETANREKSRFLATASHDLRQPLQALILFSEALKDAAKEPTVERLAGQIESSVHALSGMFNALLDVSRLDAGVIEPNWQHFSLQPLFDRLYVEFMPLAQVKGLQFDMPFERGEGCSGADGECAAMAYSDPLLLERILRNLLSNAIRYTDSGSVKLSCRCLAGEVLLEIQDMGYGISAASLPHIFEEYYQEDNPSRNRRLGLGLGLAIVRRMADLLGYKIQVRSALGEGTTFSFRVKMGDEAHQTEPYQVTHSAHDLFGAAVALVEDDPDIREATAELMGQWGCKVYAGETVEEVIRKLEAEDKCPALLISDYRLPGKMTAIQVIKTIRLRYNADIPALIVTGDTAPDTLYEIHSSGAMLLHKPIVPGRLRFMMHRMLSKEH